MSQNDKFSILDVYKNDEKELSPNHLLRNNLIELLESRNVFLKWIPKKHDEVIAKYCEIFLKEPLQETTEKIGDMEYITRKYPWETHNDLFKSYRGQEAEEQFDRDKRTYGFIFQYYRFYDEWKQQVYEVNGDFRSILFEIVSGDLGGEVYLFNEEEKWTMMYDHGGAGGPFYWVYNTK